MIWYYVVSLGERGDVAIHSRHLKRDVAEKRAVAKEKKIREVNLLRTMKIVEMEGYSQDPWPHPSVIQEEMRYEQTGSIR